MGLILMLVAANPRAGVRKVVAFGVLSWCIAVGVIRGADYLHSIQVPELTAMSVDRAVELHISNAPIAAFNRAEELPADAVVLFVAEPRIFPFPRRCIVPSQHDVNPLRELIESSPSADAVLSGLNRQGISHLLVNWGELDQLHRSYPVLPWSTDAGKRRFRDLLSSAGPPVIDEAGVQIFEL
jgi:hypothetical protein